MSQNARAVSNVLGIVLLFAIVIGGTAVVVSVGATALDDTRNGLDVSRAEKVLTQFDSRSAMVALGGTSSQGVDMASSADSGYRVDDDAGWMNVSFTNETNETSGETVTIVNTTMGSVAYESERADIAYQGGGVWKRTEAGSTMLSPPEFHFRDKTLTLPIVRVNGSPTLGSGATVSKGGPMSIEYPNRSASRDLGNPLDQGQVNVTVGSEHYQAWGRYFEQRTNGVVSYDHDREVAQIELVVPFNMTFDHPLATTTGGPCAIERKGGGSGCDNGLPDHETGVYYPSADSEIESRIEECETDDSACDFLPSNGVIDSSETYYQNTSYSGDLDIDTSGGNVTVVIDGSYDKAKTVTVTGANHAKILVKGDFDANKDINSGGDSGSLALVVHSSGEVDTRGSDKVNGLLYAPGSHCRMNGNGNFTGAAICETVRINGVSGDWNADPAVEGIDLNFDGRNYTPVTYLHVTVNPINITSR